MIPTRSLKCGIPLSRTALGLALSLGVAGGALVAQPAFAAKKEQQQGPKITFSPAFAKAAAEVDKALTEADKNPAVKAAADQVRAARAAKSDASAAIAQVDAALGGAKAKLDAAAAAASTPGDKIKLGEMQRTYGVLTDDVALQHQGLVNMLDSGVLPAGMTGRVQWIAGVTAYQKQDYAGAVKYIEQAKASNFQDPQLEAVLGDAYKRSNNPAGALASAQRDIAAAKAAGTKPNETSIRSALQAAYEAKQPAPATDLAITWVQNYPSVDSWNGAISVVGALQAYQQQEVLDLFRLMQRTNSFKNERDYLQYIEAVDARRFPGETLKVIDAGLAAGKIRAEHSVVSQSRTIANGRITGDRASLPGLDRTARAPNTPATTVIGAADAFLSYGEAAKAEELYTIALGKAGADSDRVLTRLGIAQADQGKGAAAQATLAKVQGPRKPLAQLWSAYAATKGGSPQ